MNELIFLGVFLIALGVMFVTEILPVDLTALAGLLLLALLGFIPAPAVFSGFSSAAVITLISMFIIGAALSRTGVADLVARILHRYVGNSERRNIAAVMIITAAFSAVMNNVAATALFLPTVIALAAESALPLSKLLIPLSFASLLGGTLTAIGTTSNIIVREQLSSAAYRTFEFLDFTLIGFAICAVGICFFVIFGPQLLPARDVKRRLNRRKERLADLYRLYERLFMLRIPRGSALEGKSLGEAKFSQSFGVQVIAIERGGHKQLAPVASDILRAGDVLIVRGKKGEMESSFALNGAQQATGASGVPAVEMLEDKAVSELESADVVIKEVVLAPRASVIGKTLRELDFRERFGLHVLAMWRGGRPYRTSVASKELQFGDALLVYGPARKFALLAEDADYVMLSDSPRASVRWSKSPYAIIGLLLLTTLSVFELQPIHIAAAVSALFVVFSGAVSMEEAYREIDWKVVFLVGALMPLSAAFEGVGATKAIADLIYYQFGASGPYVILAIICLFASVLSQLLDGAVAAMLLGPVTIATAQRLAISPYPLMMGVALGASIAFLTPFSHKSHLLVMGLGGYRTRDYFRVGAPITVLLLLVVFVMVPVIFPF